MKNILFAAGLVLLSATASMAQGRWNNNNGNNRNYSQRIQHGNRSGELTYGETRRLQAQRAEIARYRQLAMRDGFLSSRERSHLRMLQDRLDQQIYMERRDNQRYSRR